MSSQRQRTYRFHVERLAPGRVELAAAEAHHAASVLRLKVGASIDLFDGQGAVATGRIERVGRGKVRVLVEGMQQLGARPRPVVHVAFAIPKGKRLDWLLEKATELAAASLRPVVFERSVAGGQAGQFVSKRERWLAHCIAAAKQCGLNWLPELHAPGSLGEFLSGAPGDVRAVGSCGESVPPLRSVLVDRACEEVCLLVGPEGGMTDDELALARETGFQPVRLGRSTLRIETAAVALLAAAGAICE